jgi:hypothetical protein
MWDSNDEHSTDDVASDEAKDKTEGKEGGVRV